MKRALPLLAVSTMLGCSLLLDYDDETDLPCECLPTHVCLRGANRCVPKHSTDLFKSCSLDADNPDDLCPENALCFDLKGRGPRCLPKCVPTSYATPESERRVVDQCPVGNTCWAIQGGGLCDEGECSDLPNNCPPPQRCVRFNGAGVCFTECRIFEGVAACGGDEACHPIGDSSVTACVKAGILQNFERCSDTAPCAKDAFGQAMVCDRPANTQDDRRCYRACEYGPNGNAMCLSSQGETCNFARADVTPTGSDLGLCIPH